MAESSYSRYTYWKRPWQKGCVLAAMDTTRRNA